jgi:hypothetical protein
MSDDLSNWQRKREFYAHAPDWVRQIWPTEPSFNWYVKSRRQVLANAGVLRKLGRDWLVDVKALEQNMRQQLGG